MRPRAPRKLRRPKGDDELRAVVDETIALFHRLRWVAEQIYGEEGRSTARRGILRGLLRYGAQTVPQMARARAVTRQHVQGVVDALVQDGSVTLSPNPKHARSLLVCITPKGALLVRRMDETDARVLRALGLRIGSDRIAVTVQTLRAVREAFEHGTRWKRALA
jgi:DNA-binding MarR family transcriptional regulator